VSEVEDPFFSQTAGTEAKRDAKLDELGRGPAWCWKRPYWITLRSPVKWELSFSQKERAK
jgi:hypothetical protein